VFANPIHLIWPFQTFGYFHVNYVFLIRILIYTIFTGCVCSKASFKVVGGLFVITRKWVLCVKDDGRNFVTRKLFKDVLN